MLAGFAICDMPSPYPDSAFQGLSGQRIAKGAGGKGPRQKTSKIVKKCQKVFRHFSTIFAQGKKRQKSSESVKKFFRHFSTNFARHHFSGPFWGAPIWGSRGGSAAVCDPNPLRPFARCREIADRGSLSSSVTKLLTGRAWTLWVSQQHRPYNPYHRGQNYYKKPLYKNKF